MKMIGPSVAALGVIGGGGIGSLVGHSAHWNILGCAMAAGVGTLIVMVIARRLVRAEPYQPPIGFACGA